MQDNFELQLPAVKSWDTEIDDITGYYTHYLVLQNDTKIRFIVPPGIKLTGELSTMNDFATLFKIVKKDQTT